MGVVYDDLPIFTLKKHVIFQFATFNKPEAPSWSFYPVTQWSSGEFTETWNCTTAGLKAFLWDVYHPSTGGVRGSMKR